MAVINSAIFQRPVYRMLLINGRTGAAVTPLASTFDIFIDAIDLHLFRQVFEKLSIKPNCWRTLQDNHSPTLLMNKVSFISKTVLGQRRQAAWAAVEHGMNLCLRKMTEDKA